MQILVLPKGLLLNQDYYGAMKAKSKYYGWERTLSYDADVTMVIGARGIGKTFGLRMQCIRDLIRDGSRFCEVV